MPLRARTTSTDNNAPYRTHLIDQVDPTSYGAPDWAREAVDTEGNQVDPTSYAAPDWAREAVDTEGNRVSSYFDLMNPCLR